MLDIDKNIIKLCLKNDRRAQILLYNTFYKRVYNSCYRLLRDSCEAEDAMQESFMKAFTKLSQYDNSIPFELWIVKIAINTSIDKLRENKLDFLDINENIHYIAEETNEESDELLIREKVEKIKAGINDLTGINQIIISLYLIEGYDHEEIAEILNIKASTSRIKLMRAKQKLLEILKEKDLEWKN